MSKFRTWKRKQFPKIAPFLHVLVRLIGNTLKLQTEGWERYRDHDGPVIFCAWHGRSFFGTLVFRDLGYWVIISQSRDGEMQNTIFRRFGFKSIRGSTGRDGARVAIEGIRTLRTGAKMALAPDGPRGPSGEVQDGILLMAQKSGALIVPMGMSAQRRWIAKSWDRFVLPKPFSKAIVIFAEAIRVPAKTTPEEFANLRKQLKESLDGAEALAELRMGHP